MNEFSILIVEDDINAIASWKRDISDFNEDGAFQYAPLYAQTREEALRLLRVMQIDCAVVDLRLPLSATSTALPTDTSGNDVLNQLLIETGVPAVVYSGYISEVSVAVRNSNISIRGKKGNGGRDILNYFAERESLIMAMKLTRQKIAIESAKIFNGSIWTRWERTWKEQSDRKLLTEMITRQIASHVADQLSIPPANHHPDEFYVVPPLFTERLDTGDLMIEGSEVYVVVTPRCNLANQPYPKYLTLALCSPMLTEWSELRNSLAAEGEGKKKKGLERLRNLAIQNHSTSTHFIPPCGEKGPWLVDFKETKSVLSSEMPQLIQNRFASIATHFVPNLIQRYAAYLGRIGQPDLDAEFLRVHICK